MRRELLMPKLGLTMTEGTLVEWVARPGTAFEAGSTLFIVESDKVATEIEAEGPGTLLEAVLPEGETVECGAVIGYWEPAAKPEAAKPEAATTAAATAAAQAQAGAEPATSAGPVAPGASAASVTSAAPQPTAAAQPSIAATAAPPTATGTAPHASSTPQAGRTIATPYARRLARERGLNLAAIAGTGPRGRIQARDLPAQAPGAPAPARPDVAKLAAASPAAARPGPQPRRPSATQQTMARRLVAAKQQVPHFYLALEAQASALLALRAEVNAGASGPKVTLNHLLLAAVGRALRELPQANRVWTDEGIVEYDATDVGIAVDTGRGLLVPVLRDAGTLTVAQIAHAATDLVERTRAGTIAAEEMTGGAITVSNAGMMNVTYMTPIINPGQAMVLGVGSVRELFRPDAEGRPTLRREIGLVLAADHRILSGAPALHFLNAVVRHIEQPRTLFAERAH